MSGKGSSYIAAAVILGMVFGCGILTGSLVDGGVTKESITLAALVVIGSLLVGNILKPEQKPKEQAAHAKNQEHID